MTDATHNTGDWREIASVECPTCHARVGQPCLVLGQPAPTLNGLPFSHPARDAAWLEWEKKTSYLERALERAQAGLLRRKGA